MTLAELVEKLNLKVLIKSNFDATIADGYTGDLLSDVMANAAEGSLWITVQRHVNIIAVAVLKKIPAIVITGAREVPAETLQTAREKGIALLSSEEDSFTLSGKIYSLIKK